MPIRHRGRLVDRISFRDKDVVNFSYTTDPSHVFTNDENSDALAAQTLGTFLFELATVTVTIDAAGNVSISAVLASDNSVIITATTTADFTGTSPVNVATNRSIPVVLTIPSGYDNSGTVSDILVVAQTVDPLDTCSIGGWVNSGSPFNSGGCSAPTTTTGNPCVQFITTSGTQARLQGQVRSVTRVINGLADITNPCSGVATTRNVATTSAACTRSATNTAYNSSTTSTPVTDDVYSGTCTPTDTTAGCCPSTTCTNQPGTESGTRTVTTTVTRDCDGAVVGTPTVVTSAISRACNTASYSNPTSCTPTISISGVTPGGGSGCNVTINVSNGSSFVLYISDTGSGCGNALGTFSSGTTVNAPSGSSVCASLPGGPVQSFGVNC